MQNEWQLCKWFTYRGSDRKTCNGHHKSFLKRSITLKKNVVTPTFYVMKWKWQAYSISDYYMASFMSRQNEPNHALWLAPWAGKMELSCLLGTTHHILREKFPRKQKKKSCIDQAFLVKMAGYWPCSFFTSLWTLTPSQSINLQKKNLNLNKLIILISQ